MGEVIKDLTPIKIGGSVQLPPALTTIPQTDNTAVAPTGDSVTTIDPVPLPDNLDLPTKVLIGVLGLFVVTTALGSFANNR